MARGCSGTYVSASSLGPALVLGVAEVQQAGALDHALPRLALQRVPQPDRLVCEVGLVRVRG